LPGLWCKKKKENTSDAKLGAYKNLVKLIKVGMVECGGSIDRIQPICIRNLKRLAYEYNYGMDHFLPLHR